MDIDGLKQCIGAIDSNKDGQLSMVWLKTENTQYKRNLISIHDNNAHTKSDANPNSQSYNIHTYIHTYIHTVAHSSGLGFCFCSSSPFFILVLCACFPFPFPFRFHCFRLWRSRDILAFCLAMCL